MKYPYLYKPAMHTFFTHFVKSKDVWIELATPIVFTASPGGTGPFQGYDETDIIVIGNKAKSVYRKGKKPGLAPMCTYARQVRKFFKKGKI